MDNKEIIKLNKSTVQAIAAYLGSKPYSEVADIANTLLFEANNQAVFIEQPPLGEQDKKIEEK